MRVINDEQLSNSNNKINDSLDTVLGTNLNYSSLFYRKSQHYKNRS